MECDFLFTWNPVGIILIEDPLLIKMAFVFNWYAKHTLWPSSRFFKCFFKRCSLIECVLENKASWGMRAEWRLTWKEGDDFQTVRSLHINVCVAKAHTLTAGC